MEMKRERYLGWKMKERDVMKGIINCMESGKGGNGWAVGWLLFM
jgi:hypothetical protein